MFKVVAINDGDLIIQDEMDNSFDVVNKEDAKLLLNWGVAVGGASLAEDGTLVVSDEYFIHLPLGDESDGSLEFDSEEDDDYYEDESEYEDDEEDFEDDYDDDYEEDDAYEYENDDSECEDDYDDYEDDYDNYEDDEEEDSTVGKLYASLTEEQVKVLKRYYLWYSQRIFAEAEKDPTLDLTNAVALKRKKENLNNLRKSGGTWYYAGFIDMGRKGEGFCTLGHPLRYMHLAWDVTVSDIETAFFGEDYSDDFENAVNSSNCIVFGIKCISDFFEVNKDCVKRLQAAQRESLKDMAILNSYKEQGVWDEYSRSFGIMDALINKIKVIDTKGQMVDKDYKPILTPNLIAFYLQFRSLDMVPPKSLIQEIRDRLIGWSYHKFVYAHTDGINPLRLPTTEVVADIIGKVFRVKNLDSVMRESRYYFTTPFLYKWLHSYFCAMLVYESCSIYKYDGEKNKDEGGSSKKTLACYNDLYSLLNRIWHQDNKFTFDYMQKVVNLAVLLQKKKEVEKSICVPYIDKSDSYEWFIDENEVSHSTDSYISQFSATCPEFYDSIELLESFDSSRVSSKIQETIDDCIKIMSDSIQFIEDNLENFRLFAYNEASNECISHNAMKKQELEEKARLEAERIAKEEEERNRANEVVENSGSETGVKTPKELVDYLSSKDLSQYSNELGVAILKTVTKSGSTPSDKQMYHLKKLYKKVSGIDYAGQEVATERKTVTDDIKTALEYIISHPDLVEDKTCDIAKSVLNYGTFTPRQEVYVNKCLDAYKEAIK